ncbi:uncharacterized protein LOC123549976 [Mercenaria mercenaria]|uniref:uncharacterized protein LOC123549976 n=1 Tax=Mercenaria mercenaria TaxID=6596 RepID=UPI00234EB692|nr:uncharacterized protein LOC123549976 [Mercenaria mercenaria]XP_053402992.1 uncharacterized protein LOC123549976 [Mercenaria mercenaria]
MMGTFAVLLILLCLIPGLPAAAHTKLCRNCHHLVTGPTECMELHHCHDSCITEVYIVHGEHKFRYGCVHPDKCDKHHNQHTHEYEYGQNVCSQCCDNAHCQRDACSQNLTTTLALTTMTTAHTTTMAVAPAVTSHQRVMVNVTQTHTTLQPCVDLDDVSFTCADMTFFGYCNPNAGAGYALAQKRCRKTCGFCT